MSKYLIVEDYPSLQEIYQAAFEKAGHTVHVASDGREALDKCSSVDYDAIILDMLLPNLDGITFLKEIDINNSDFKPSVIVLSDFDKPELVNQAKALGIKAYLTKTHFSPAEAVIKIQKIIEEEHDSSKREDTE